LVNEREKLPEWDHLWFDLVQEEIRWNTRDGSSSKHDDEDNFALDRNANKEKGDRSKSKGDSGQACKKKDLLKIKCLHCHELGHYSTKFPHNKVRKNL